MTLWRDIKCLTVDAIAETGMVGVSYLDEQSCPVSQIRMLQREYTKVCLEWLTTIGLLTDRPDYIEWHKCAVCGVIYCSDQLGWHYDPGSYYCQECNCTTLDYVPTGPFVPEYIDSQVVDVTQDKVAMEQAEETCDEVLVYEIVTGAAGTHQLEETCDDLGISYVEGMTEWDSVLNALDSVAGALQDYCSEHIPDDWMLCFGHLEADGTFGLLMVREEDYVD